MSSHRELRYSAQGLTDAFVLHLYGPCDAAEVVFLQAGFPDDHGAFAPLATRLASGKCLCGVTCMPGYDRKKPLRSWGFSFPEAVDVLHRGVLALLGESTAGAEAVTLVLHDWGSVVGTLFANTEPQLVRRLVVLDVAPLVSTRDPSLSKEAIGVAIAADPKCGAWLPLRLFRYFVVFHYQSWFAAAFLISRWCPRLGDLVMFASTGFWIRPLGYLLSPIKPGLFSHLLRGPESGEAVVRPLSEWKAHMCYVYYHFIKSVLLVRPFLRLAEKAVLPPGKPTLFIYGQQKNALFHDRWVLAKLHQTPGCAHLGLPAGHFFLAIFPEVVAQEVAKFLQVTLGPAP